MKLLISAVLTWATVVAVAAADRDGARAQAWFERAAHRVAAPSLPAPVAAGASHRAPARAGALAAGQSRAAGPVSPTTLLADYCLSCHNERLKTAGLALDTLDVDDVGGHAETWEKVVLKVKTGLMPPAGMPRPPRAALDAFAAELEGRLDAAADVAAGLSTPALHRLNRTEYANAIRDLLDLRVDVTALLPGDGSSEGFDNLAEALAFSPALVQGYVSAAMKISRLAVGDRAVPPAQTVYPAPPALAQGAHIEGLPLGTRGGMVIAHVFPLDAEYEFSVAGGGGAAGTDVTLDGERIPIQNPRRFRVPVTAGPHDVGVAVVDRNRGAGVDDIYSDFRVGGAFTTGGGVQSVTIVGPFAPTGVGDTPSRRRIFTCRPASADEEVACARRILTTLARRAYRGPVADAEVDTLLSFYRQGRQDGDFETGIQQALARVLVAPRFVFRIEEEPRAVAAGAPYRLDDVELASRLSFFLWSSIPDEELLALAEDDRLHEPAVLRAQVARMLTDAKSAALVENFAGQWLYLRDLATVQTEAAGFDDNLRAAFRRETELLFETIVREDRSVVDLLDADYTFVDERLARHYGMAGVRGSHMRRVPLAADSPRRGLLGHGSMLTVTSVATRTSPVSRGKWILENLLGAPPPQPPPGVETNLEADAQATTPMTLRQRLEMHRAAPACAACHQLMDPIGFSLENFDLIGAWRETDGEAPVDAAGQLVDGTRIRGPVELRRALLTRGEAFVSTAAHKLLMYALGRPVTYADMPTVRAIVRRAAGDGNRFSSLVLGIVESAPFQMRVRN